MVKIVCLEHGADWRMAHCHSLSLASVKSRLGLPFWYWLTRVVLEKGPFNRCVCVCACVHVCVCVLFVCLLYRPQNLLSSCPDHWFSELNNVHVYSLHELLQVNGCCCFHVLCVHSFAEIRCVSLLAVSYHIISGICSAPITKRT